MVNENEVTTSLKDAISDLDQEQILDVQYFLPLDASVIQSDPIESWISSIHYMNGMIVCTLMDGTLEVFLSSNLTSSVSHSISSSPLTCSHTTSSHPDSTTDTGLLVGDKEGMVWHVRDVEGGGGILPLHSLHHSSLSSISSFNQVRDNIYNHWYIDRVL